MMRSSMFFTFVLFFVWQFESVGASGYQVGSPWPSSRGASTNNSAVSSYQGSMVAQEKWEYSFSIATGPSTNPWYISSPVIGLDGSIYVSQSTGIFYAMYPWGSVKWSFNHGSNLPCLGTPGGSYYNGYSSPVIDSSGNVYAATLCTLYAFSAATGATLWSMPVVGSNSFISSPIVGNNGIVYIASSSMTNSLTALYPSGTVLWNATVVSGISSSSPNPGGTNNPNNNMFSSPAIGPDGTIYFTWVSNYMPGGARGCGLYAFSSTGSFIWYNNLNSGNNYFSSVVIAPDGSLYVGVDDMYTLYALYSYGSIKWSLNFNMYVNNVMGGTNSPWCNFRNSPAVNTDGTIYFSTAVSANYMISVYGMSQSVTHNRFILFAMSPFGSVKWNVTLGPTSNIGGNTITSSPSIGADGTIYAGSLDNHMYAINSAGTLQWSFATGGQTINSSPAIGADGTIYVTSDDSALHAINICPAGSFGSNTLPCAKCPSGSYSSAGATACTSCPASRCSSAGSASCSLCTTGSTCQAGQYSILASPSTCIPCPAGQYSTIVGAVGASSCSACAIGTYSSVSGATGCSVCPSGTTTAGATMCTFPYQAGSPWPHARGISNNNTNLSPYVGTQRSAVKWSYQTDITTSTSMSMSSITIDAAGNLYYTRTYTFTGTQAGPGPYNNINILFSLSPLGTVNWYYQILSPSVSTSTPTLAADGSIYISSGSSIYAFTSLGSVKWTRISDETGSLSSPILGYDGTLFVTSGMRLLTVSPQGALIWRYFFQLPANAYNNAVGNSYPTIGGRGTLFVCTSWKQLYAFRPPLVQSNG